MGNEKMLYLDTVFPDQSFLQLDWKPYEEIKDTCIFVLDTNILLSPYRASPKSFDDIKTIYTKLKEARRLQIPFRVLQEYAKNRGNCLQVQYSHFDKISRTPALEELIAESQTIPILQGNAHINEFNANTKKINGLLQKRNEQISAILSDIKDLYWNDPIFDFYKATFSDEVICKLSGEELDIITNEMKLRYDCDIPPGFADRNKVDGGIGDLIIWKTILLLGGKSDIVFVSNDRNKDDWFYVSEVDKKKTAVAPRFELLVEFKRSNPRFSLDFMDFPTFLEAQAAKKETVHELAVNLETPYVIITEEAFRQELNEAYYRFTSKGGFLASRYFIETYLANKGYDIRSSWNMYYKLKEGGIFREYQHQDQNSLYPPQNAIALT